MTISYILGALIGSGYIIYIIVEYFLAKKAKNSTISSSDKNENVDSFIDQTDVVEIDLPSSWIELPNKIPVRVYGFKVPTGGKSSSKSFPTATKYAINYEPMPLPIGAKLIADQQYQENDQILIDAPDVLERWK